MPPWRGHSGCTGSASSGRRIWRRRSGALGNRPVLLDVTVTPEAVSSDAKTGLAWVPDLQPVAAWDSAERAWREGMA